MVVWVISEDFRDDDITPQGIWWESLPLIDQAKSRFFGSQLLLDFHSEILRFPKKRNVSQMGGSNMHQVCFFHLAMFRTTDSPQVLVANCKGKCFIPEQNPGCNSPRLLSTARYLTGNWYRWRLNALACNDPLLAAGDNKGESKNASDWGERALLILNGELFVAHLKKSQASWFLLLVFGLFPKLYVRAFGNKTRCVARMLFISGPPWVAYAVMWWSQLVSAFLVCLVR